MIYWYCVLTCCMCRILAYFSLLFSFSCTSRPAHHPDQPTSQLLLLHPMWYKYSDKVLKRGLPKGYFINLIPPLSENVKGTWAKMGARIPLFLVDQLSPLWQLVRNFLNSIENVQLTNLHSYSSGAQYFYQYSELIPFPYCLGSDWSCWPVREASVTDIGSILLGKLIPNL